MVKYRLLYFDMRGAGETPRMIFHIAGVEFEDVRYTWSEWPNLKPKMPLQTMPVLEVDGRQCCNTNAITRYLGRKFDLMGGSPEDEFRIEELMDTIDDMYWRHVKPSFYEPDQLKQKEMVGKFIADHFDMYLNFIEKRLKENNNGAGFYCGNSLTVADLSLYNMLYNLKIWSEKFGYKAYENRPTLDAFADRVAAEPKVAEWIKIRPVTDV